jgi:hypothetical protein
MLPFSVQITPGCVWAKSPKDMCQEDQYEFGLALLVAAEEAEATEKSTVPVSHVQLCLPLPYETRSCHLLWHLPPTSARWVGKQLLQRPYLLKKTP